MQLVKFNKFFVNFEANRSSRVHFICSLDTRRHSLTVINLRPFKVIFKGSSEHFCGGTLDSITTNQFKAFVCVKQGKLHLCNTRTLESLPLKAYSWLVKHLSSGGIDVGSKTGHSMVAALQEGRNVVWLTTASQNELSTLDNEVVSLIK